MFTTNIYVHGIFMVEDGYLVEMGELQDPSIFPWYLLTVYRMPTDYCKADWRTNWLTRSKLEQRTLRPIFIATNGDIFFRCGCERRDFANPKFRISYSMMLVEEDHIAISRAIAEWNAEHYKE